MEPLERLASIVRGEAGAAIPEDADADAVVRLATSHGVEHLIADRLEPRGEVRAPRPVRDALWRATREWAAVELVQGRVLRDVLGAFDRASIRPLLYKGAALAYTHYERPYHRPRIDIDLLARPEEATRAGELLERAGYERAARPHGELVTSQQAFVRTVGGVRHVLDVHRRVVDPQIFAQATSYEDLRARAIRVPELGEHAWAPAPPDALVLACIHRLAHHPRGMRLIWVYDVHRIASRMSDAELDQLERLARRPGVAAAVLQGLDQSRRWFGTSLAPGRLDAIRRSEDEAPTRAMQVFLDGGATKLDILRSDLESLPTWRARTRLLAEHAFPAPSYMLKRYPSSSRAWLPALYAHRLIRGAWRWMTRSE